MKYEIISGGRAPVAVAHSDTVVLRTPQDALDWMVSLRYESGCTRLALNREALCEDFFVLRTGLAGEILQKFVNYGVKFAVYGDISRYTGGSKALRDFVYECNRGRDVFFAADATEAARMLGAV